MKRVILIIAISIILFTACSNIEDNSSNINNTDTSKAEITTTADTTPETATQTTTETIVQTTAEATSQTTAQTALETAAVRELKGDMTIRTGIKLDTAEFNKIWTLIDGKVITFKDIGEPYLETSIERLEAGIVKKSFCEQEIGYINCKTGEKVSLCRIKPIASAEAYVYLDSTYAYVIYNKSPDKELSQYLNEKDYDSLVDEGNYILLQINVKTNEVKEYDLSNAEIKGTISYIYILGRDSVLIEYYPICIYPDLNYYNECINCLNLKSGKISNFSLRKDCYHDTYELPNNCGMLYSFTISEDKAYFAYEQRIENEYEQGFRVYDSHMNMLNETKVSSSQIKSADIKMYVHNNKDIYYRITHYDIIDGSPNYSKTNDTDYKFTPSGNRYISADKKPFEMPDEIDWESWYLMPRSNSDFPFNFYQGYDKKFLCSPQLDKNLKIDINGFIGGWHDYGFIPMTDYNGDYLAISGTNQRDKFDYYYIPKEEIKRALYGE